MRIVMFLSGVVIGGIAVAGVFAYLSSTRAASEPVLYRYKDQTYYFLPAITASEAAAYRRGFSCALRENMEGWQRPIDYGPWVEPAASWFGRGQVDGQREAQRLTGDGVPSSGESAELLSRFRDVYYTAKAISQEKVRLQTGTVADWARESFEKAFQKDLNARTKVLDEIRAMLDKPVTEQ